MPNAEITRGQVDEWILALRSGDYKQTTGALSAIIGFETDAKKTAHCCLGVYGLLNGGTIGEYGGLNDLPSGMNENSFIPNTMITMGAQHFFSELNDSVRLNFYQIANVVQWLPLIAFQDSSWWSDNDEKIRNFKKGLLIGKLDN
jgi:hypothetical protein